MFHENVALLWAHRHEIYCRPESCYDSTGDSHIGHCISLDNGSIHIVFIDCYMSRIIAHSPEIKL